MTSINRYSSDRFVGNGVKTYVLSANPCVIELVKDTRWWLEGLKATLCLAEAAADGVWTNVCRTDRGDAHRHKQVAIKYKKMKGETNYIHVYRKIKYLLHKNITWSMYTTTVMINSARLCKWFSENQNNQKKLCLGDIELNLKPNAQP